MSEADLCLRLSVENDRLRSDLGASRILVRGLAALLILEFILSIGGLAWMSGVVERPHGIIDAFCSAPVPNLEQEVSDPQCAGQRFEDDRQ